MKFRTLSILLLLTSTSLLGQQYSKVDFVELKRSNIDSVRNVIPDRVGIREFNITIKNNDIEINSFNEEGEVILEFAQGKLDSAVKFSTMCSLKKSNVRCAVQMWIDFFERFEKAVIRIHKLLPSVEEKI